MKEITVPATKDAKRWDGYGTALKPAHEPIAVFTKDGDARGLRTPIKYQAKTSTKERHRGCDGLYWLDGLPIDRETYLQLKQENEDRKGEEGFRQHPLAQGNTWPTVKPLELMRYLVRLVKMPDYNLILDPFCGSGSTLCACILEDCGYVGIDMDKQALEIARKRINYCHCLGEKGLD